MKDTYEAVTTSFDNIKDKKIIELAKNKRALQMQVESLRTKAAKAAQHALDLQKRQNEPIPEESPKPKGAAFGKTTAMNDTVQSTTGGQDDTRKLKELEKKVVKLRQENSAQSSTIDKAVRLLEREIGEVVDIE